MILPVVAMDEAIRAMGAPAATEGFSHVTTLIEKWDSGANRFDRPGETYLGVWDNDRLVAISGLNRDPYRKDATSGRVRHVYVIPEARRSGAGTLLMDAIVAAARSKFAVLRLRTNTARGAAFYEALGFARCDDDTATHVMALDRNPSR